MPASFQISATDRVLVVAPHPDDETLAAGAAIQCALQAGAAVRILYVTDGDNNPWPQRWLEKRWSIGAAERTRWGERRRQEAAIAREALGVAGRVAEARHLGWHDQGLTDALMRDDVAIATLVAELSDFAPTCIVMPALGDRHPDHSALRVMLDIALLRAGSVCQRLCYVVHGNEPGDFGIEVDAARLARKQQALEAYVSQLSLSRRRLLELAARPERFVSAGVPSAPAVDASGAVHVALGPAGPSWWRHELLLVLATRETTSRFRSVLPRYARGDGALTLADAQGRTLDARIVDGVAQVASPSSGSLLAAYAKLHRSGQRIIVFDRTRWHDAHETRIESAPAIERSVATGLG
jgi:LmbE family N-acetylglucosaminyl deacetylase